MKCRLVIDGKEVMAEYLGSGAHSRAYRAGDTVYLLTAGDKSKALLAAHLKDTRNPYLPRLRRHADWKGNQVFSMPYLEDVSRKHKTAWRYAQELMGAYYSTDSTGPRALSAINRRAKIPKSLKEALRAISQAIRKGKPSSYVWDIGRYNLGVDKRGRLVLRDVVVAY